jgi:hypothetical protein
VLVSMVPLVACAIRVSNALPEAWLNNQAYQNVTAAVCVGHLRYLRCDALLPVPIDE